jgi:hypothetical protein
MYIVDDNFTVILPMNGDDRDEITSVWEGLLGAIQDRALC